MEAAPGRADVDRSPGRTLGAPTVVSASCASLRGATELDDAALAARARDGDPRSFEVLLRRYQRQMYILAARITGSSTDAEDVIQLAFLTAWRKLPAFRGEARFSTWLYRIVTNQSLSHVRRRTVTEPIPDDDDRQPVAPAGTGPEAAVEHGALADALASAVGALPADLRAAWLLREAERCSYEEVAAILAVTPSTARGRIARARARLAESLAAWR